ncbi:MAG: phage tail sheath C-terminal domain-containing protein [Desulfobulbus sp.]
MSESISEMILPGTYIEVRAEGLIGVGGIATGNIGIVGTAARGPKNEVVAIGNYAEALDFFGEPDAWSNENKLTLVRTAQMVFQGGGKNVYAVRIANGEPVKAAGTIHSTNATTPADFTMTAKEAGTYGNQITYSVTEVILKGGAKSYVLALKYRNIKEVYEGINIGEIHALIDAESVLVDVSDPVNAADPLRPATSRTLNKNADGGDGTSGLDHANVSGVDLEEGLAVLENEPVNILVVAGFDVKTGADKVGAHLERTENIGKERIAVLGASSDTSSTVETDAASVNDDRIVLVAPGMTVDDPVSKKEITYPPSYLAAVIAGKLSTLAPHVSMTNKEVSIKDLSVQYNETVTKKLLNKGVLLVRTKFGKQVVRAITSQDGPFKQISIRRVVDYAKAGVRKGADPYIGRLNNARVRAALKATLDGFLSQMLVDEMLVGYELDVSATRSQEINGIAAVTMTLKPTFSIDFIRVTMNLE